MRRTVLSALVSSLLFSAAACLPPRPMAAQPPRDWAKTDFGAMSAAQREAAYAALLDDLLPGLGAEKLADREQPQKTSEQICFRAGRPGADAERVALCQALLARLGPQTRLPARVWLLRQLERLSGDESVDRLAQLLDDEDAQIRELARRALQNNGSPRAAHVLRDALTRPQAPEWRAALIYGLAARPDAAQSDEIVSVIAPFADASDTSVAVAAILALADLRGARAAEKLHEAWTRCEENTGDEVAAALLLVADRAVAQGQLAEAERIYLAVYESEAAAPLRIAALRGLTLADQTRALSRLLDVILADGEDQLRIAAVQLLRDIPGPLAPDTLAELSDLPGPLEVVLLSVLGERGARDARAWVAGRLASDDESVRLAALRTLAELGTVDDIVLLATHAANTTGPEHDAARHALARLHGEDVDATILKTARDLERDAGTRAELIRSLADRFSKTAVHSLFELARDASDTVRQAALESLGKLAASADLPRLVDLLVVETDDDVRQAAEDAVATIALKLPDRQQRVAPVLATRQDASGAAKAALIRVLGRLQGDAALQAVRAALADPDEDVADAAVRALSQWDDLSVLDELRALARSSPNEAHRVLVLRGGVRLLRLPSDRPPETTLDLLQEALSLAARDEEKKLVLSALGDVPHADALRVLQSYLAQESLRDEAAVALATLARRLAAEHRDLALAALQEVRAAPVGDAARQRAADALKFMEQHDGYISTWRYAGPYAAEGKKLDDLMETVFAPEQRWGGQVPWQPLRAARPDNPWLYDLTKVSTQNHCCVFVEAKLWSPVRQPARLELGSDDAVKVWLNGQAVYSHAGVRGLRVGEDKVAVTLKKGWNTLRLKVVQADGAWGFACGVRGPDGTVLRGVRFRPE